MLNFVVFQNFDGFLLTLWRFYCVCFGQSIETIVDGFTKDLKEMIGKGLGFVGDDFKVSSFDFKDARVGNSVAYEFELEIDNQVFPLKFLENAKQWEYVDLPIFQIQEQSQQEDRISWPRNVIWAMICLFWLPFSSPDRWNSGFRMLMA